MNITCKKNNVGILNLIGTTPVVNILTSVYPDSDIRIKLESYNPGGSIKDRVALKIITDAELSGKLTPGDELVEATSGNTGIGIAWIGHLKGYKVTIVTHDRISKEKLLLLKYYGANIIIMPSDAGANSEDNYVEVAKRYANQKGRYFCNQFFNYSNVMAHYSSTAPELWLQGGLNADAIVCGVGSGGTLMGIHKYFREKGSQARFIVADPIGSIYQQYFSGVEYHPVPWSIEGIGSNFIPGIIKKDAVDDIYAISDEEAFSACRLTRYHDSIDIGLSSGAVVAAAIKEIHKNPKCKIMCISPDSGERYISKFQQQDIKNEKSKC
ncbi:cysteine synthase family protein [Xenorhabdus sp. XENO-10]|uniref:cysteine synthase n=1 Tax=Xenorhabdus yunnanensis TaxID=3025878 RepID=A0ABT5LEG8_9GAMM|nr:cysteine synthase family protein [Xenorhabdus yunnanensis]MDC9588299.1 cysteine synthase family protein [Xenorhabdus yunnanensis]